MNRNSGRSQDGSGRNRSNDGGSQRGNPHQTGGQSNDRVLCKYPDIRLDIGLNGADVVFDPERHHVRSRFLDGAVVVVDHRRDVVNLVGGMKLVQEKAAQAEEETAQEQLISVHDQAWTRLQDLYRGNQHVSLNARMTEHEQLVIHIGEVTEKQDEDLTLRLTELTDAQGKAFKLPEHADRYRRVMGISANTEGRRNFGHLAVANSALLAVTISSKDAKVSLNRMVYISDERHRPVSTHHVFVMGTDDVKYVITPFTPQAAFGTLLKSPRADTTMGQALQAAVVHKAIPDEPVAPVQKEERPVLDGSAEADEFFPGDERAQRQQRWSQKERGRNSDQHRRTG